MRYMLMPVLLLMLAGCNSGCNGIVPKAMTVNITLENASTNELWARLNWTGPWVPGGILPPGKSAVAVSVEWPNLPSATLAFVDDKTRQKYETKVDFASVNKQMNSGKYHDVLIRILAYDKTEVTCR